MLQHDKNSSARVTPINVCETGDNGDAVYEKPIEHHRSRPSAVEAAVAEGATATNEKAETLLAHELNRLTFRERESINEEIHGIGVGMGIDEESPEILTESFRGLQTELVKLCSTEGGVDGIAFAFQRSQELFGATGTYLNSEALRIMFLRCESFDCQKAAVRLCHYADYMYDLYGDIGLERRTKLSDIPIEEVAIMKEGFCQNLRARDRAERRIFIQFVTESSACLPVQSKLRIYAYYIMALLHNDASSQRKGIVCVLWFLTMKIDMPTGNEKGNPHAQISRSLPLRIGAIHYLFPRSDGSERKGSAFVARLISGLARKFKPRARMHWGSPMECLYTIESFGIPSKQIPLDFATGKIAVASNNRWLESCASEEKPTSKTPSTEQKVVECPKDSDVLLGRGKIIMYHPGNIFFRKYIELKLDSYKKLCTKKETVQWTRGVVQTFQNQCGTRFLKEEEIIGTNCVGWVEVSNDTARSKVRVAFRDAKARLAKVMGKNSDTIIQMAMNEREASRIPTSSGRLNVGEMPKLDEPISSYMPSLQQQQHSNANHIDFKNSIINNSSLRDLDESTRQLYYRDPNGIENLQQTVDSSTSAFVRLEDNGFSEQPCCWTRSTFGGERKI